MFMVAELGSKPGNGQLNINIRTIEQSNGGQVLALRGAVQ
jgi:hypothetical protein